MKAKKYWLLAPIIIALILAGCDSDNSENDSKEAARVKKEREIKKKIQELCSKHNAVTDWIQRIEKKRFGEHTYTMEVQYALVGTESRPVLFTYAVYDIVKESDKYLVYFSFDSSFSSWMRADLDFYLDCNVHFVLDCTVDQVKQVMDNRDGCYAVIAQISEVEKVRFKLKAYGEGYEDVMVDLDTTDVFLSKGKCLDLLFIPDERTNEPKTK